MNGKVLFNKTLKLLSFTNLSFVIGFGSCYVIGNNIYENSNSIYGEKFEIPYSGNIVSKENKPTLENNLGDEIIGEKNRNLYGGNVYFANQKYIESIQEYPRIIKLENSLGKINNCFIEAIIPTGYDDPYLPSYRINKTLINCKESDKI